MATTAFTSLLPEVLPSVPGCADIVAVNAIRNSVIEFCERTLYWQELQDSATVTTADFPYDLKAPAGARVTQVLAVIVNGTPIDPTGADALAAVSNWQNHTAQQPLAYYHITPQQIGLYPALGTSATLQIRVAYAPTRTATAFEEYLYQTYMEALADGALYRLLGMPGRAWSNPELGLFHRRKFQQAVQGAAVDANKTFSRTQLTIQMRAFA